MNSELKLCVLPMLFSCIYVAQTQDAWCIQAAALSRQCMLPRPTCILFCFE